MQPILEINEVYKNFSGIKVLKGISSHIARGKVTALIGSNGAGKSTLLNIVSGFLRADSGRIAFDGNNITDLSAHRRARLGLGRTFQHPRSFRSLTVLQSVILGATPHTEEGLVRNLMRVFERQKDALTDEPMDILVRCRLDHLAGAYAAELSYGEQKLLMLAQTLAHGGSLLCFDELCAGLEEDTISHVRDVFRTLVDEGQTVLFIEHNLKLVRELADWIIFLHLGKVFCEGKTEDVLRDPDVVKLYLGQ